MRIAREWKVPHSGLDRWTSKDIKLARAYLEYLDDIGPCGHPHSKSTTPGYGDDWMVDGELVCEVCAKLDDFKSHERHQPGAVVRLRNVWDMDI